MCSSDLGGYYFAAALGGVLFSVSEKLLFLSQNRARQSLVSVYGEQTRTAWLLVDGVEMEAPLLLTMEETFKEWTDWGNWLFSADVALPPDTLRWKMGSYRLAIEAAMQGIGVAMGWTWLVQDLIDAGRLVEAHPHRLTGQGQYYLMRSSQRHLRQSARRLADWLVASNRHGTGAPVPLGPGD